MKLIKLEISNFGKFNNKTIELKENFILIHGNNESGKTTCVKFIEGVFYGFVKPYLKTTRYTNDLDKYRPWNSKQYEGSIILESNSDIFRVYRNFNTGDYKIFNEQTGEDITEKLEGYKPSNKSFPGEYFFKVASDVFNNTKIIGQNNIGIDKKSSNNITDLLLKNSTDSDEFTNSNKSVEYLKSLKRDIGSRTNSNKPLGQAYDMLSNLEKEENIINDLKREYDSSIEELSKLEKEFLYKNKLFDLKNRQIIYEKNRININIQKQKEKLLNEISDLKRKISQLEKSKDLYKEYLKDFNAIKNEEKNTRNSFDNLSSKKREKHKKLLKLTEKIKEEAEFEKKSQNKILGIRNLIIILTLIGLFFLFRVLKIASVEVLFGLLAIFIFIIFINFKVNKKQMKSQKLENLNKEKKRYEVELNNIDREIEYLLNDEEDLAIKLNKLRKDFNDKYNISIDELQNMDLELNSFNKKLEECNDKLNFIIKTHSNEYVLNENISFSKDFYLVENMDIEKLRSEKDEINRFMVKLRERISMLDSKVSSLPKIKEQKNSIQEKLIELEKTTEILELTLKLVEESIEESKIYFIPKLIKMLNNWLGQILGKNIRFYVDESLNISFNDNKNSDIKSILSMSKGSQDIIYLVLKIALSFELYSKVDFLILDDAFNYFDEDRLKDLFHILKNGMKDKQIIILTCQERELQISKFYQEVKVINI